MPDLGFPQRTRILLPLQRHPQRRSLHHRRNTLVEVAFVFLNFDGLGYNGVNGFAGNPFAGKQERYKDLVYLMASSWASFVTDLDPNSFRKENTGVMGRTERWPIYAAKNSMDYVFDANVSSYAEPDTFREEGIALINSAVITFQR